MGFKTQSQHIATVVEEQRQQDNAALRVDGKANSLGVPWGTIGEYAWISIFPISFALQFLFMAEVAAEEYQARKKK